jgi:histidinol-phosphatase
MHRPYSVPTMPDARTPDDLTFALLLADAADEISAARFGAIDLVVDTKPDLTPVSDADRAVETAIRMMLAHARPRDAIVGEEFGTLADPDSAGRRWVVDPIDGTKNFVRGVPVWATLIALMEGAEVLVGVVSAPALSQRWWAAREYGSWTSRPGIAARRNQVSAVASLDDASFSYSDLGDWGSRSAGFRDLSASVWRTRAYGDFWSHMLVAEGAVDISAETDVKLWDLAALQIIVEEAGGTFTDLSGKATPAGGSAVCTNGLLHEQVLSLLTPGSGEIAS